MGPQKCRLGRHFCKHRGKRREAEAGRRGLDGQRPRAPGLPGEVFSIKTVTLTENYEFRRLYKKGKSFVNPIVVVYILKNRLGYNRIGLTTSKKVGGAVQRNRARRVLREAYRRLEGLLPQGYDFVFVARTRTCTVKEPELRRAMRGIFYSAKLIGGRAARSGDAGKTGGGGEAPRRKTDEKNAPAG